MAAPRSSTTLHYRGDRKAREDMVDREDREDRGAIRSRELNIITCKKSLFNVFSNIVDKKWFESLMNMKVERLVNVEIRANSTTIFLVTIGFGFCILLICGGLCAYFVYKKNKKPAKKQVV